MRRSLPMMLLALAPLATTGCGSSYVVHGKVSDCSDQSPIAAAAVRLELSSDGQVKYDEASSTVDGAFDVTLDEPASNRVSVLIVRKGGYAQRIQPVTRPQQVQEVCLELLSR